MYTLVFSLIWTVLMTVGVTAGFARGDFAGQSILFQAIFAVMPLAGLVFIRDSLRKLRRYRSVRQQGDAFIWTGPGGSERRSTTDPRIAWDAEDRDFSDT